MESKGVFLIDLSCQFDILGFKMYAMLWIGMEDAILFPGQSLP